jgi:hypothetical protein
MAGYTPGPWDLTMGTQDAAIHAGGTIAMVDDTMTGWEANAAVIAAAPDLLEALEAVIDDLKSGIQDGIDNGAVEAWLVGADARLKAARAAIRKARGEV